MPHTLPAHLRKKDEDTVAHLFEKAVEDEMASLMRRLKEAGINLNKRMGEISIEEFNKIIACMGGTFDDAYRHIEGDDAAVKVEIMQAYIAGDEKKFFALHDRLYKQSIARQAERNVLENEVDNGD